VAALLWAAGSPVLRLAFFRDQSLLLVALCAVPVFTQQLVAVGKAILQGSDDLEAANVAIVAEEAAFLPTYLVALPFLHGSVHLVVALVAADVLVAAGIWARAYRRGLIGGWMHPRFALAKEILLYGLRGQVGGVLLLLNLRLDFALLGAIAGPAVLGVYAIASKYAELLRLPGLAITYVLYPRFTQQGSVVARSRTRALLPRTSALTVLLAVPLLLAAGTLLPLLYGNEFRPAVVPAWILIGGLTTEGAAGLITAYLYATGRPGMNSLAIGFGVIVTGVLDVVLIPHYAATGAAIASTVAYLTTTVVLLVFFASVPPQKASGRAVTSSLSSGDLSMEMP
jgi:O-antigen/teichoic acid export membrane protein